MRRPFSRLLPGRFNQRGYALLLMMVLLTIGVLFTVVSQVSAVGAKYARTQGTSGSMQQAKEALLGFAATYRDSHSDEVFGYLPCPDTDGDGIADSPCGSAGQTVVGLIPYRTLGIDAPRDGSSTCLWYVVSGTYKDNPPTVPLNWDTQGNITVIDANGNTVTTPDDVNGGGAAVIIAAGAPLNTQSRTASTDTCNVVPSAAQVAAYLDGSYTFPATGNITLTEGSINSDTNNDLMVAITPKEIFDKIITRADFKNASDATTVGQLNSLNDTIKAKIESQILTNLTAGTAASGIAAPDTGSYTQYGGKQIGDLASTLALTATSDINYLANWRNQYRYVVCSTLTTACLTIGTKTCRAALMFGGRSTVGGPRTSSQNTSTTANLGNFFEAGKGLEILNSSSTTFSGNTSYLSPTSSASEDVAYCLFPGSFISFAQNIANFSTGKVGTSSLATVNTGGGGSIVFGSSGGGGGAACTWNPTAIEMGSLLRLYFRINWTTRGNGLALAFADGATNLSPTDGARTQIMCGAGDSDGLGYSGIPASGTVVGIQKPKLGIEFDTRYDSARNDTHGDHMAVLYWGDSSGSASDDTTHYIGTGGVAITAASWTGGTATITTASTHGLSVNEVVLISGMDPSAYDGTYTVASVNAGAKQFTVYITSNPGTYVSGGNVLPVSAGSAPRNPRVATVMRSIPDSSFSCVSRANTSSTCPSGTVGVNNYRVTVLPTSSPNMSAGQKIYVTGMTPNAYNGVYTVQSATNTFPGYRVRYCLSTTADPGAYSSADSTGAAITKGGEISTLSWTAGTASATMSASPPFSSAQIGTIFGVTPSGYDATASLTKSGSVLSYTLATDPDGTFAAESPAGMALVKTTDAHLPYSSAFPTGTNIHVRLDITRSYDTTNHVAVLNIKAYVGDTFSGLNDCSSTEFQDLSQDLADMSCDSTPMLQQDSIPVNRIAAISAASWSSGTNLVTATATAHGVVNGASVTISGATPTTYNGTYTVTVVDANTLTYNLASNPGTYVSGGDIEPLSTMYIGFTNARSSSTNASEDQSVTVDKLILRSQ